MITVNVDELFVSWLAAQLPAVGVASERPAQLEDRLPFVVVRRGAGGDLDRWLDGPLMDLDFYANDRSAVGDLARQVDGLFRTQTPAYFWGVQFSMLRAVQAPIKVSDANQAVRRMSTRYAFSLQ